jgi:hypothetical protein
MHSLIAAVVLAMSAASLGAQTAPTPAKIDPGMTKDQVVAELGQPVSVRSRNGFTYLLYRNSCEKKCGMNDLVVLDSGKVVDAVFRSSGRKFTGTSSSPHMITGAEARKGTAAGAPIKIDPAPTKASPPDSKTPSPALHR